MSTDYDLRDQPKELREQITKQVAHYLNYLETRESTASKRALNKFLEASIESFKIRTERLLSELPEWNIILSRPYQLLQMEFGIIDELLPRDDATLLRTYESFSERWELYPEAAHELETRINSILKTENRPKSVSWLGGLSGELKTSLTYAEKDPDLFSGAITALHHCITRINGKLHETYKNQGLKK